jgi:hypothetical protein
MTACGEQTEILRWFMSLSNGTQNDSLHELTEILRFYFSGLSSSFSLPTWQLFFVHVGFLSKGKRINWRNAQIAMINIIHRKNPILSSS